MQPGQTITPQQSEDPSQTPDTVLPEPVTSQPVPSTEVPASPPEVKQATQPEVPPEPQQLEEPQSNWQYQGNNANYSGQSQQVQGIVWTASEYIDHEKRASWFITLSVGALVFAIALYVVTKDVVSGVIVLIAAGLFGVTGARKPRTLEYELTDVGVRIENKYYPYDDFKSFSVLEEGAFSSVQMLPLKRFLPALSLYYPPEQEDAVLNVLGSYLPHEERSHDPIDRLMRRVRF